MKNFNIVFGGIIAYILLLLYSLIVLMMILGKIEDGANKWIWIVNLVGGLVSALVISQLALAKPGNSPSMAQLLRNPNDKHKKIVEGLAVAYLLVWLIVGLAALLIGNPDDSKTLYDIGTTWLGLAVTTAYAYFGLDPGASGAEITRLKKELSDAQGKLVANNIAP